MGALSVGMFGAPACRCTTNLVALAALCFGLIVAAGGACALLFFPHENLVQVSQLAVSFEPDRNKDNNTTFLLFSCRVS